jgi:hypothetical protein
VGPGTRAPFSGLRRGSIGGSWQGLVMLGNKFGDVELPENSILHDPPVQAQEKETA